jgi:hypothetical protein
LAKDISIEMANTVFDKATQKVIKDTVKHTRLVSTTLYYSQMLKHLSYLMTNYYLITSFIVLLAGAKAADKGQSRTQHLPDQGLAASREG